MGRLFIGLSAPVLQGLDSNLIQCGDSGSVHDGKEGFRYIACRVKLSWAGVESCYFTVCHFFAVAVIIGGDGAEFLPKVILGDMTVIEVVAKCLLDGGAKGMIVGLFLQSVASANGRGWVWNVNVRGHPSWKWIRGHPWKWIRGGSDGWEHGQELIEGIIGGMTS